MIQRVLSASPSARSAWPLHSVVASRAIEENAVRTLPPHTLMARAGWAVAKLAQAVAPDAKTIWVACGPGNNGGDGLEAAVHLHRWAQGTGKRVVVTWLGDAAHCPADTRQAREWLIQSGLSLSAHAPAEFDLTIDALLGLGASRAPEGTMQNWVAQMNASSAPVLAVDVPTGLNADTGALLSDSTHCVRATHTLSLLTLKPGLFTAHGREQSGEIWFDDLQVAAQASMATAWLGAPDRQAAMTQQHATHKGNFGDVCVIGGDTGMTGAALLAADAALRSGCGRVYVSLLDACIQHSDAHPDWMFRTMDALDLRHSTVVCGCGGGQAVAQALPRVISQAARLVLDADALNAIAQDVSLQALLQARAARSRPTIITPHPLEAARLLQTTVQNIQSNRLHHAQRLSERFQCVVVLKGSGSVVTAPGQVPRINPSGNARLSTAGTGDILAGMLGGGWSRSPDCPALEIAGHQVRAHGMLAEHAPPQATCASDYAKCIRAAG